MCPLLIIFGVCFIILYFFSVRNHNYWRNRNVTYIKSAPFWISDLYKIFKMPTATESATMIYKKFPNEKFVGFFIGRAPGLLVNDPEMFKHIFVQDFEYFYERTVEANEEDPMFINLFHASGDNWKLLRHRLTSAFTVHKLQKMYPHVLICAERLKTLGGEIVNRGGIVSAYELMARFTMDFICNCGLGIDFNIIMDENSNFFKVTSLTFKRTTWQNFVIMLGKLLPLPKQMRGSYFINPKTKEIIKDIVIKVCENRHFEPSDRHDFVDLLLGLAAMGKIKGESMELKNPDGTPAEVELDLSDPVLIAAQAYIFVVAGYETSALSTSVTLHQLAYNQDVQRKIQEEIDAVLSKYNKKLCYDAVAEMTLLEMAFYEAMRLFPAGGLINRTCRKKYTFPGTNLTIDPGVFIVVPAAAIHSDERYFPDPNEFRPERFTPEAVKERNKHVYMPFGQGKRLCIGSRLGQMQSMAGLAALLQRFSIEPAPQSQREMKVDRSCRIVQGIEGGLPIKLVPRNRL